MKLFITASTSENQPMTILESIMFGIPIIGVDAKGIPELIDKNGFIVGAAGDIDGDGDADVITIDQFSNVRIVKDDLV